MKIIRVLIVLSVIFLYLVNTSCDNMEDNYKQYLQEYNYSGKIDSLRVYPGFERVVLAWDNPKDQKSKTIRIVYGPDSTVVDYDTLVDSVSIENLNAGTGYEFIVYTMDAKKNLSVPTSITAFPVSQEFVDGLTPPSIVVQTIGAAQYISLMGLSNVLMKFSGNISYTISNSNGFNKSNEVKLPEFIGESQVDIPVAAIGIPFLPPGEYNFEYKVSIWPIIGNALSADEVWLVNTVKINISPVVINLMQLEGVVTDKYNNGKSPGGERVEKVIDGDPITKYLVFEKNTWIMWKMNSPFVATKYTLTSANDAPGRDPKNWIVEGSNDGMNWTELDKQDNFDFSGRLEKKFFLISNQTAYSHYRINITENHGDDLFQLSDWILYYDSGQ